MSQELIKFFLDFYVYFIYVTKLSYAKRDRILSLFSLTLMPKQNLKGLDREELATFITGIGEQPFRAKQLFRWIYGKAAASFDEITDLAKPLRQHLQEVATLE